MEATPVTVFGEINTRPSKRQKTGFESSATPSSVLCPEDTTSPPSSKYGSPAVSDGASGSSLAEKHTNEAFSNHELKAASFMSAWSRIHTLALSEELRYTPPPSELHRFLPAGLEEPPPSSSASTAEENSFPAFPTSESNPHQSSPDEEKGPSIDECSPHQRPKLLLKIPRSPEKSTGQLGVEIENLGRENPIREPQPESEPPPTKIASHAGSKNSIAAEERFQRLLARILEDISPCHSLDAALQSILTAEPAFGRKRTQREDISLTQLPRVFEEYSDDTVADVLLKRGFLAGTMEYYKDRFEAAIRESPVTPLKLLQVDEALGQVKSPMDPYRNPFTNWVEAVISTIHHIRFTDAWKEVRTTREKKALHEEAFEAIHRSELANWDREEGRREEELKLWTKQFEKMTISRNQIVKLYNTFGATVLLEANTLRPVEAGDATARTITFALLAKQFGAVYRTILAEEEHLLVFQATFWEDGLEADNLKGDDLYRDWVTRSHLSAGALVVSIVKAVAGEATAAWVSEFLSEYTPDGFEDDEDSDSSEE
ncbi:hypothetical protein CC2G_013968 [Coprinopsis cinerea AmutBmut pab1-1]|nr:hypothetical protein CC2G_013968 [Coprinopsis cinerea AmutBmut pab1-1]